MNTSNDPTRRASARAGRASARSIVLAAALGAVAFLGGAAPACAKTEESASGYNVTYQVFGSQGANTARIRYQTQGGMAEANAAALPWSYSFHLEAAPDGYNVPSAPVGVYVDAPVGASVSPLALYTCQIWVNGQLMEDRTRDAAHVAICFPHDD